MLKKVKTVDKNNTFKARRQTSVVLIIDIVTYLRPEARKSLFKRKVHYHLGSC